MEFCTFASYLGKLETTSSRLKMTEILADLFSYAKAEEIDKICYLALGQLAPKYKGIEFNMAEKMMIRSLALAVNKNAAEVALLYKKSGDLGNTAYVLKNEENKKSLSVAEAYDKLMLIAKNAGLGSVERKILKMSEIIESVNKQGAKIIARMPLGRLRLGFSDMTILDALSWMDKGDKSLRKELERAFNVLADIGLIAKIFKTKGIVGINRIKSEVGIPIRAAKAERLAEPEKILEKMKGECVLEPKYDGVRVQLHLDKTRNEMNQDLLLFNESKPYFVRIFSRNLEDTTYMFPDIAKALGFLNCQSAILDGEAIAYNPKTGRFLPFQETVQRKRKHGVMEKISKIPLKVFIFDLLFLNGVSLLNKPFKERRKELESIFKINTDNNKKIVLTEQKLVSKSEDFNKYFNRIAQEGLEGLMAKKLNAVYQAGARNANWIKYKVGMRSELADTIDAVVMGYYFGKGKRTNFGIGAFLVGVYDGGKFLTTSKIGTGLTDEKWRQMFFKCQQIKAQNKPKEYQVHKNLLPDVWCLPKLVVEIEADTITKSPTHTAKLALRFPRLKKIRDDKSPKEATSLREINNLFKLKN